MAEVLYAHVYPNPYLGSFTLAVQSPETGMATVELFDATGKKIMTRQLPVVKGVKNTISFTGIRQQFLMYKITVGKQIATGKITGLN